MKKTPILTLMLLLISKLLIAQSQGFPYNVEQIPYQIYTIPQPSIPDNANIDDRYSAAIPLNFDFNFFGITYSELGIGNNGNITFNSSDFTQWDPWEIPNVSLPSGDLPKNNIFGVYTDIDNSVPPHGNLTYGYAGTAPFRKFVVFFDNIPLYSCNSLTMTSQIILYETYNFIDVQVDERTPCTNWNHGYGIIGIQNADASLGYAPPGRDVGDWTADNEGWRFRPVTTFPDFQYILCDANLDGVETFDMNVILSHYTAAGQTVSIHLTEADANNNVNPVTGNYDNVENAQTLYVRLDNGTNFDIKRVLLAAIDCNADYDADHVLTNTEDLNGNGNFGDDDTDGDGIPNFLDDDDDGDNILTIYEDYNGDGDPTNDDLNNNNIPDYLDNNIYQGNDRDNDGILDTSDLDDDNDGIPDTDEYNGVNPDTDADNDGVPVFLDDNDNDNSIGDNDGMPQPAFDFDGDGVPNHFDIDSDGDGLYDLAESGATGFTDANMNGIIEGNVGSNGLVDVLETSPDSGNINYNLQDTDNDGTNQYNFIDFDDDNDHVPTPNEQPDNNANGYPDDALDTDSDGTPNYLDVDDDGDGVLTINEDYDGNGTPENDDINNNGIPDYLDSQVTNSISQLPDTAISLYPNPSKGFLNISSNIEIKYMTVKIYTFDGKLIKTLKVNDLSSIKITMPKVKGIYLVRIQTDKGLMQKSIIRE